MSKPYKTSLTLEDAQLMISRLQSQINRAEAGKITAQARLFDIMFEGKPIPENAQLKADYIYMREELSKVVGQRDKLKKENLQLRAENKAFKETFKVSLGDKDGNL